MFDKSVAGVSDTRVKFEVIKNCSNSFLNVKLYYANRRWNEEADCLAKQGIERNLTIKK